jgi:hypothetical protein
MLFRHLLGRLRPTGARVSGRSAPHRATYRPALERLDERCLPSAGPGLLPCTPAAGAALIQTAPASVHEQPFYLSGAGQVLGNPFASTGAPFIASGHATQLGAWTNSGTLFLTPDGAAHGDVTFVAANGDQLHMTFIGQAAPDGHATATFTIDGGTGRFRNARGVEHMEIDQDFQTGAFTFTLTGTISFADGQSPTRPTAADGTPVPASHVRAAQPVDVSQLSVLPGWAAPWKIYWKKGW